MDSLDRGAGGPRSGGSAAGAAWAGSELHFRRLLETLPAGAYTCDAAGLITYFNGHAVRLWGREPRLLEPVDRFCGSFKLFAVDGTPIRHDQCWMALALKERREYNGREIVIQQPDGRLLTALAHASPLLDEEGRLLGGVNVLVDITDRKQAEDALRAADRSKDEFLAVLAHELRNPLAPIRNAVHLLQRGEPHESDTRYAVAVIDRQMRHMTRLIDDLMDVARITRDRFELRRRRITVQEALEASLESSRPVIHEAGHELATSIPAEDLWMEGDLTRLAQVFSNLLHNAAKYTPRKGRIQLTARREGASAVITVQDNGVGIPREDLPALFSLFARGAPSSSRGGLGIGLGLARRLVEMHHGRIEARSEGPGRGSAFVVTLPLCDPQTDRRDSAGPAKAGAPGVRLRVLVVDDNRDAAESLSLLLMVEGHEARVAHDGEEALREAAAFHPDVVLLDVGLPGMSGHELARRLRQGPAFRRTLLVALTGWGQPADRELSRRAGCDLHLVKPVDPARLLELLLKQSRSPDASSDV